MRIQRKTVQQILMSKRELQMVLDLARKAEAGQTVHYAEEKFGNIHFGVGIDDKYDNEALEQEKVNIERKAAKNWA